MYVCTYVCIFSWDYLRTEDLLFRKSCQVIYLFDVHVFMFLYTMFVRVPTEAGRGHLILSPGVEDIGSYRLPDMTAEPQIQKRSKRPLTTEVESDLSSFCQPKTSA